jgi:polysaccharide deacetylase 2 family uncharacterized protein YibQ
MIPENLLNKFNPEAKVPHSRIKKLMITIRQFAPKSKNDEELVDNQKEISPALMQAGMEITEKLETAKDDLITELVSIFFSLSNEEKESLDFEVREEMFQKISSTRHELITFLSLSSPSSKTKMESQSHPTE